MAREDLLDVVNDFLAQMIVLVIAIDGDGCVHTPTEPGLGVTVDEATIARYQVP